MTMHEYEFDPDGVNEPGWCHGSHTLKEGDIVKFTEEGVVFYGKYSMSGTCAGCPLMHKKSMFSSAL